MTKPTVTFVSTLVATLAFLLLAVVTLPLWLVPLFWPMLPVLLFAYLNQRVFRHDALAEHASAAEMQQIFGAHRADLFLMGVVVGIAGHIPVLGFFVPVYAGLAFIHYGLARLQALRDAPVSSVGRIIEG